MAGVMGLGTGVAQALPIAQVDILGGSYCTEACDDTVITTDQVFTVFAYGNTATGFGQAVDPLQPWYLSVALTPQSGTGTDFGSFSVDGTAYTTADLLYGIPPVEFFEELQGHDAQDLPSHGVFPTLFLELEFNWDTNLTRSAVNVEDNAGTDPTANPGDDLYYYGWDVDISGLLAGFGLHFDLYSSELADCGRSLSRLFDGGTPDECVDVDVDQFAPFSHDGGTRREVPEPMSLSLLGGGLLLLGLLRRRIVV